MVTSHHEAQEAGLVPQLLSVEMIHEWYLVAMSGLSQNYESFHDVYDVDRALHFSLLP